VGFSFDMPSVAGRVMEKELRALYSAVKSVKRPCVFILGGVKVDDSIKVMENALETGNADYVLTTGLVANIFLWGAEINIKKYNRNFIKDRDYCDYVKMAKKLIKKFPEQIKIPLDLAVYAEGQREEHPVKKLPNLPIYDIGTDTIAEYVQIIRQARTIFANGPAGVFEKEGFNIGTEDVLNAISSSTGFSIIGGGHLAAAANRMGLKGISHISSGGGASISLVAGEKLPAVEILRESALRYRL
jgi:phosphoglycerate kinase